MRIAFGFAISLLWSLQAISAAKSGSRAAGVQNGIQFTDESGESHGFSIKIGTDKPSEEVRGDIVLNQVFDREDYGHDSDGDGSQKGGLKRRAPPSKPPATKPPAPKPPAPKPPVSKPTPVEPTPAKPIQTPLKPKPIKTCAQLALADTKDMVVERSVNFRNNNPNELHDLFKRSPKLGKVCNRNFNAYDYPSRGVYIRRHPDIKYYGFADPYNCDDYLWRASSSVEPRGLQYAGAGQTEHVMEWQSVTGFFNWMSATHHAGRTFRSPDPTQNGQLSFCDYITLYWDLIGSSHRFALAPGGQILTPREHVATAYPHNNVDEPDFVLLQDKINSPAKAHMWDDSKVEIHGADTNGEGMTTLLRTEPRTVVQRLRYVVGARKYQSDRDIAAIFVRMKNRIRAKLAELDQALPANPRPTFNPWDPTIGSLATAWDTYMDGAFLRAKAKQQRFMDKWIIRVRNEYCTPALQNRWKQTVASDSAAMVQDKAEKRALCDSYNILVKQWKGVGPWNRPW